MKTEHLVNMGDECDKEYITELDSCHSLLDLQKHTEKWQWIARDAYLITMNWSVNDFDAFRRWRNLEKKGEFQGEAQAQIYSPVLMPEKLFKVSIIASQFNVPWGVAYRRAKEEGVI